MTARTRIEGALALLLAVAIVVAALAVGSGSREPDLRTSSFVSERRGARALHLVLERLGLAPERLLSAPSASRPPDATIAVLAPSRAITREEARALLDWTAGGGRLLVADAPSSSGSLVVDCTPLLAPAGLVTSEVEGSFATPRILVPDLQADLGEIEWPARIVVKEGDAAKRDARAGASEVLVDSDSGAIVRRVPFGEGEVVAISDARLFDNEFLRKGDDALLAVRLLAGDGTRRVFFDEFHHGFGEGAQSGVTMRLFSMLWTTWPGRAMLVLLLAAAVYAAGAAVRFGAPDPDPRPRRRALSEHADALGHLLESARASKTALEILLAGVRRVAGPRAGIPARLPAEEFRARLARSTAQGAPDLAESLAAAEDALAGRGLKDVRFAEVAARVAASRARFLSQTGRRDGGRRDG